MNYLVLIAVVITSSISAIFSKRLKTTHQKFYFFLIPCMSVLTGLTWAFFSRYTKWSLSVATIIFDVVMSLSYFFMFLMLGESITFMQGIGVVLALGALIFLSI